MELIHTEDYKGGTIKLYAEDCDYSFKGEVDREIETWIDDQLDNGNNAAWFNSRVVFEVDDLELADDYMSGHSYKSFEDFRQPGGYYEDMCETVYEAAKERLNKLKAIELE